MAIGFSDTTIRSAPTLETERLRLRAFRRDDLDAHAATLADPEVMRHLGGAPTSREDIAFATLYKNMAALDYNAENDKNRPDSTTDDRDDWAKQRGG